MLFAMCYKDWANRVIIGLLKMDGGVAVEGVFRPLSVLWHDSWRRDELNHFVACVITNCSLIRSIKRHSSSSGLGSILDTVSKDTEDKALSSILFVS